MWLCICKLDDRQTDNQTNWQKADAKNMFYLSIYLLNLSIYFLKKVLYLYYLAIYQPSSTQSAGFCMTFHGNIYLQIPQKLKFTFHFLINLSLCFIFDSQIVKFCCEFWKSCKFVNAKIFWAPIAVFTPQNMLKEICK